MIKLLAPLGVVLALVLITVLADRPQPRADLRFINRGDLTTMDLHLMSWMQDLRIARMAWEGLVRHDVFTPDYTPQPTLATHWDISPDGTIYTFHMRREAKWSNGSPVLPSHLAYSWRRAMLPEVGSDYVKFFALIKGGQDFPKWRAAQLGEFAKRVKAGEIPPERRAAEAAALWDAAKKRFDETVAIRADDAAMTFTLELVRPVPYFLDILAFPVFSPVYPPLLEDHQSIDSATARLTWDTSWTKPPKAVFNGPMMLTSWRFQRDFRMERNPHYWNPSIITVDSISVPTVEDPNAQVLAFETGSVDWVSDVVVHYRADMLAAKQQFYSEHAADVERMRAEGLDPIEIDRRLPPDRRNRILSFPAFGTYFFNFNCNPTLSDGRPNPFHDPRVRRAFALAVDKRSLVDDVRRSGEPIASTLIPPDSIPGYESPKGLAFDPDAARRLLAEAGYPNAQGFIRVEILFNKEGGHDLIAQAIAKNWQKYLGVEIMLDVNELKVFREKLKSQNFMISRAAWFGDYGDPTTFLDINRYDDGNNDRKFNNASFESLLDRAAAESNAAARLALLTEAERLLVEQEFPLIPLFHYRQFYLFDPHKITGISSHPRSQQQMFLVDVFGDGKGTDQPRMQPLKPPKRKSSQRHAPLRTIATTRRRAAATGAPAC